MRQCGDGSEKAAACDWRIGELAGHAMRPEESGRGSLESPSQVVENTSARFGGFHVFLLAAAAHGDRHECLRHIGPHRVSAQWFSRVPAPRHNKEVR